MDKTTAYSYPREDVVFQSAPWSDGERILVILLSVLFFSVGVAMLVLLFVGSVKSEAIKAVLVGDSILAIVFGLMWFCVRIRELRFENDTLVVVMPLSRRRIPLTGLESIERHELGFQKSAVRVFGYSSISTLIGVFWSKQMGRFTAYVSNRKNAVLLRWAGRCVVVSPEQTSYFVEEARKRAGLAKQNP